MKDSRKAVLFSLFIFLTLTYNLFMWRISITANRKDSFINNVNIYAINITVYIILGYLTVNEFYPMLVPHFFILISFFLIIWHKKFNSISKESAEGSYTHAFIHSFTKIMMSGAVKSANGPWVEAGLIVLAGVLCIIGVRSKKPRLSRYQ